MARKPKPTHLHVMQGTFRPDRHSEDPTPGGAVPDAPDVLPPMARQFYDWARGIIEAMGLGSAADSAALEAMAWTWWRYRAAIKVLDETSFYYTDKNNVPKRHPAAIEASDCQKELRQLWGEYGMTPSARARLGKSDGGLSPADKARFGLA